MKSFKIIWCCEDLEDDWHEGNINLMAGDDGSVVVHCEALDCEFEFCPHCGASLTENKR